MVSDDTISKLFNCKALKSITSTNRVVDALVNMRQTNRQSASVSQNIQPATTTTVVGSAAGNTRSTITAVVGPASENVQPVTTTTVVEPVSERPVVGPAAENIQAVTTTTVVEPVSERPVVGPAAENIQAVTEQTVPTPTTENNVNDNQPVVPNKQ